MHTDCSQGGGKDGGGNVKAEMEQWGWVHPLHREDKIWLVKVLNVSFGGI